MVEYFDGVDLFEFDIAAWRSRISAAFQDYAKLEVLARETVGVGDLECIDDDARITAAVTAGAADEVVSSLPRGLETQLGTTWPDVVGLSGGQWQRLALARGMMRDNSLLRVLDEPTAALDASTEHSLFERYAAATQTSRSRGAVTILITHRFSTVAAADRVIVMDNGRITEQGTHHELLKAGGHYAELYGLQARGYR
nr:ABC transporter ATP-binding protein [Actinopolymorpha alba]